MVSIKWRGQGGRLRRPAAQVRAGKERHRVGGLLSTRSPLGLVRPDRDRQARSILRGGGQRNVQATGQENPKLFPPDGLGIGAGGGIPPMGAGGGIELLCAKLGEFLLVQSLGNRSRPRRPLVVRGRVGNPGRRGECGLVHVRP